jgi:hypothetical protein
MSWLFSDFYAEHQHLKKSTLHCFLRFVNLYLFSLTGVLSQNFIIVADYSHGRILQVDIDTGNLVKLPISATDSSGLVFDKLKMEIFYSELATNTIMSTKLHGKTTALFHAIG